MLRFASTLLAQDDQTCLPGTADTLRGDWRDRHERDCRGAAEPWLQSFWFRLKSFCGDAATRLWVPRCLRVTVRILRSGSVVTSRRLGGIPKLSRRTGSMCGDQRQRVLAELMRLK